jgi:hypothetical protein
MRRWISAAPALRTISTSWRVVEPRTIESSTSTTLRPAKVDGMGLSLRRMPSVPQHLARFDEGPSDVPVLDEAVGVGDARHLGVSLGGGDPRLRHRHDDVGHDRMLAARLRPICWRAENTLRPYSWESGRAK